MGGSEIANETHAHDWTPAALDDLPMWTLVRAHHSVAARLYQLFARHDLTPTQFGVLAQLAGGAAESQATLARQVLITPQSLHVLVEELETRALVQVSGPRGRGRRQRLTLTAAGWRLIDQVRPELDRLNAPEGLGLSRSDGVTLNRLLHAIEGHLAESGV